MVYNISDKYSTSILPVDVNIDVDINMSNQTLDIIRCSKCFIITQLYTLCGRDVLERIPGITYLTISDLYLI